MEVVLEDFRQSIHSNATITATGASSVATDFGNKEVSLFINITVAPTGTTPTITFTLREVDPGNEVTVVGTTVTGAALNSISTQILTLPVTIGGSIQVTWTVTGAAASFTGVYATLVNKGTSPAIYDQSGNGPVAVKAASTAAVAADPALVVSLSPNSPLPAGTNTLGTVIDSMPDLTATGALGALNAAVQIATAGYFTAGMQLAAGTLIGTIVAEASFDGGTTWNATYFDTPASGKVSTIVFASANTATGATFVGVGGTGLTRVRVSAYTSGTANVTLRATTRTDPSVLFAGPTGAAPPPSAAYVGGTDGTNLVPLQMKDANVSATATDPALVVSISPNIGSTGLLPVDLSQVETVFKHVLVSGRLPQVSASFNLVGPANLVTSTLTGTGTVAGPTTGTGSFSTGTGTTGRSLGVTFTTVNYSPHEEIYAAFTASFTAGRAGTYQRIGLYNTTDGFSFGYNGTTFGLWSRFNSVDTFTAQTAWNIDTLSGAATSKFTRAGTPEALVQTDINLYRVRFGWLGIAPVLFEVLSADGNFITVHSIRYPNSQTTVSITNPYLPITVDVNNNATGTTNLTVTCGCWVGGTSAANVVGGGLTASITAANANGNTGPATTGSSVTGTTTGLGIIGFVISGTWVGTISFQFSMDGNIWDPAMTYNPTTGAIQSSTTANGTWEAAVGGYRAFRAVCTAYTSGTAMVTANGGLAPSYINTLSAITDGANDGPVAVKPASTSPLATDAALVVTLSPNSAGLADVTATGALGALNAAVQVNTAGLDTVGFQLAAGTLIGTIVPEVSFDGGTTWNSTFFNPTTSGGFVSSFIFASANTATAATIVGVGGSGLSRVRVSAYTSGTANITVRATTRREPSVTATNKPNYGTNNQAVTITIAGLVNAAARASTAINNATTQFEDVLFFVKITTAASGTLATGFVNIFGYGSVDGGTTYSESITGTDAAITLTSPPNLVLLATLNTPTNGVTYRAGPFSFCRTWGLDELPTNFGFVVQNESGATLNATAGNQAITYQGINGQLQ